MQAEVNATMKSPSILLEDIDSITKVDCSATSVDITFDNQADYDESMKTWPSSAFTLFTNHLGDCDTDNERGLYDVSSLKFNFDTLTITAATEKCTFNKTVEDMAISFCELSAPSTAVAKREVTQTFLGDFPGTIILNDDPLSKQLSISVHNASLGGSIGVKGHVHYNFFHAKASKFYIDVDLSIHTAAHVEVTAGLSYDNDVYTYSPASLSVSAFSIPGLLDLGPKVEFDLGVEVAASGSVDISADLTATLSEGYIHLDLLNSKNTITSGWKPVYTHQTNISVAVEAQVNPFVSLTTEIACSFLNGLLDLSSGITARPELLNVFDINATFDISNSANVTLPAATEDTCVNGMWYSSAFAFIVTAFVTQFYELELYRLDVPIYKSGCWSWAAGAVDGN
jgi:hypothetical protein